MSHEYTLGAAERLKSRKLIQQLFKEGRRMHSSPVKMLYMFVQTEKPFLQAGFGVSAKNFKRANKRNRIKRLMREAYRLQKPQFEEIVRASGQGLVLFFLYTGNQLPQYPTVFSSVSVLRSRIK